MEPVSAAILGGASLLGSLGGAGLSIAGAKKPSSSTHLAKLNLKYGKLYDEWTARNMPTFNRAGMEAAGFNPILAITAGQQAHGMANTPGHGSWDAFGGAGSYLSDAVNSAANLALDLRTKSQNLDNMKAQKDVLDTQADLNEKRKDKIQWDMDNPAGYWQNVRRGFDEIGDFLGENWSNFKSWLKAGSGSSAKDVSRNVRKTQNNYYIHYHNDNNNRSGHSTGYQGDFIPWNVGH